MLNRTVKVICIAVFALGAFSLSSDAHRSRFYSHNRLVHVAATNPALADIAKAIGGDKVYVTSLLKVDQDVKAPKIYDSMFRAVRDAKLVIRLGKGTDPWVDKLIDDSKNREVAYGEAGHVDCSKGIKDCEFFWQKAENKKSMAQSIRDGLSAVSPKDEPFFQANFEKLLKKDGE